MNCKQGDLAIVVQSKTGPEHVGKIIKLGAATDIRFYNIPGWRIDGAPIGGRFWCVADRCVRPIRDQPGDDETLEWSVKPQGVTA